MPSGGGARCPSSRLVGLDDVNSTSARGRRKNGRSGRGRKGGGSKQLTCRASGHEASYSIASLVGTGGVLNANSGVLSPTDTGGRYTIVVPDSIGPRCAQLARLYNEWRINSLVFKFVPNSYYLGTQSLASAPSVVMNGYGGFTLDPTTGILVQTEIVEAGGKEFNFARPCSFRMGGSRWLFTSPRTSDTLSDNRFISPGIFNLQSGFVGPETPVVLGQLEAFWDISFRYPIDADVDSARVEVIHGRALLDRISAHRAEQDERKVALEEKKFVPILPTKAKIGKP